MILTLLLAVAVIAAMAGAYKKNVTSFALLASFVVSTGLCSLHVPFNLPLWVAIDLAVVAAMIVAAIRGISPLRCRDIAIIGSFGPVWTIYLAEPAWGKAAIDVIVALQMLLTFPVRRVWFPFLHKAAKFNRTWNPWDGLDLRARYGVA